MLVYSKLVVKPNDRFLMLVAYFITFQKHTRPAIQSLKRSHVIINNDEEHEKREEEREREVLKYVALFSLKNMTFSYLHYIIHPFSTALISKKLRLVVIYISTRYNRNQ